ncbi:MAG TPA: uroporphyrinogen decarboxylase [Anaerolineae bacterium]|nr:uroporphyrinogen decarboxylase [Anaerolineae bacterium]
MTSKQDRLIAAIAGQVADRPPVALWRHFPVDDQDPDLLASATAAFQQTYDFDFVKVTPASSFCLLDWGAEDAWRGKPEGTRTYTRRVIQQPEDWRRLKPLDPTRGALKAQLRCLQLLGQTFGDEVPLVQTIFSPLAQAKNLSGGEILLEHLRQYPDEVETGLRVIQESTIAFVEAAKQERIAGIFYAIQHASHEIMDPDTYARFGEAYDLGILEVAQDLWLNVLHLHGGGLMFDLVERLPYHVVNWHDRDVGPNLAEARGSVRGAVCGGLHRERTLVLGDPASVRSEAQDALQSMEGRGVILGAGCVVPVLAPRANLMAAVQAAKDFA